ncbi:MAG: pyrroline-5-carboxylate reductase [Nitrococcus sp.]|nr:pyrroline-5-carboxylate reductase [Nitrococcus sp.]
MPAQRIAFIGGGNMAHSLIGGLMADGYPADCVHVAEPDAEKRRDLANRFGIIVQGDNQEAIRGAKAVVFAVKPQTIKSALEPLGPLLRKQQSLVISIAAGVRESDISRWLGGQVPVVRSMPNTPALVRAGATALYANEHVSQRQRDLAESLLRAVGITQWLDDESLLDIVTALSGSGPAYFFLLMEILEKVAIELGLPQQAARLLTLETALGAARMALESDEDPACLRQRVTSAGGTTQAATRVLENGDLHELFRRALQTATDRARELGRLLGEQ